MILFREAFLEELEKVAAAKVAAALSTRLTPQSTSVKGYSYDPKSQSMLITFKSGATYRYKGITPSIARAMGRNKSVGKTVHRRIKQGGFEYEKVANDPIKETIKLHGITIAIEWRKGETRRYYNHDPLKARSKGKIDYNQKMHADYGYVKGVIDADGEELDVYLGPNRESVKVFVLEKLRRTDSSFDENKIMLGYDSLKEARASYLQHQGKDELGSVYELSLALFKQKFLRKNKFKKHGSGDSNETLRLAAKRRAGGKYLTTTQKALLAKHAGVPGLDTATNLATGISDEIGRQIEKYEKPINIGLGAALGGGLGIPVGAMVGGAQQGAKVGRGLVHPNPKAGGLRRLWWAKKHLPKGEHLAQGIRRSLGKGAVIGGAAGLLTGGLLGLQIARALKGSREARAMNEQTLAAMAKLGAAAEEALTLQLEPHEPLPTEVPVSQLIFDNLTARAKTLSEDEAASQEEQIIDKMAQKRRHIAKLAGACVKTLTWGGLTMKFEYLIGQERSGIGAGGKKWSRKMKDCYGYIPGTYGKGADGEAIDVYFSPNPQDGSVYKIRQLTKEGKYDEDKFLIGYGSSMDAKAAFSRNMPKWAFGDITEMSMKSFRTLVGQEGNNRRVPKGGNAELAKNANVRRLLFGSAKKKGMSTGEKALGLVTLGLFATPYVFAATTGVLGLHGVGRDLGRIAQDLYGLATGDKQ